MQKKKLLKMEQMEKLQKKIESWKRNLAGVLKNKQLQKIPKLRGRASKEGHALFRHKIYSGKLI